MVGKFYRFYCSVKFLFLALSIFLFIILYLLLQLLFCYPFLFLFFFYIFSFSFFLKNYVLFFFFLLADSYASVVLCTLLKTSQPVISFYPLYDDHRSLSTELAYFRVFFIQNCLSDVLTFFFLCKNFFKKVIFKWKNNLVQRTKNARMMLI